MKRMKKKISDFRVWDKAERVYWPFEMVADKYFKTSHKLMKNEEKHLQNFIV